MLDFLFLVGELEEARYNGDSAETALIACDDNIEKVILSANRVKQLSNFSSCVCGIGQGILAEVGDLQGIWVPRESYS